MAIREHNNDLAKQLIQHPDCDVNAEAGDLGYPYTLPSCIKRLISYKCCSTAMLTQT